MLILRSLLKKQRPKVTSIQEEKTLNISTLKDLISSFQIRILNEDEPKRKSKFIILMLKDNKIIMS